MNKHSITKIIGTILLTIAFLPELVCATNGYNPETGCFVSSNLDNQYNEIMGRNKEFDSTDFFVLLLDPKAVGPGGEVKSAIDIKPGDKSLGVLYSEKFLNNAFQKFTPRQRNDIIRYIQGEGTEWIHSLEGRASDLALDPSDELLKAYNFQDRGKVAEILRSEKINKARRIQQALDLYTPFVTRN